MERTYPNGTSVSTALCAELYVYISILGVVSVCPYVVTCTHDGHGTRERVSGAKKLIRHQRYRSPSISTNTPSTICRPAVRSYPVPTSCNIFLPDSCLVELSHFVTLSTDVACWNRPAPPPRPQPQPHFTVFDNTPTILTQFLPTLVEHTTESPAFNLLLTTSNRPEFSTDWSTFCHLYNY